MGLGLILLIATSAGTFLSFRSPSEKEMLDSFSEAQRFYAEGSYSQAIEAYDKVARVRSQVLDAQSIIVEVGEASYPVQEAAVYQVGNSNRKLFGEYAGFGLSATDDERRTEFEVLADSSVARSAAAFRRVIDEATHEALRGQAYGRLIELYYEAQMFRQTIEVSQELIAAYGDDPLTKVGYYNTGWSHFQLKEYEQALVAFQGLVDRFPSGFEADRSLFQIGECFLEMERYDDAVIAYRDLVDRQRLGDLSDAELKRMEQEKLAGLVDETALELAAKGQIRIGTALSRAGRYDEGVEAFREVIDKFSTERALVEEAFLQMAALHDERGDADAATRTYREAIREARDRTLRARIQYALAERLFSRGDYEQSISEYRIYLQGYDDVALQAGFASDRVRYRLGSAYQQWAQSLDGDAGTEADLLTSAIVQYDSLLAAGESTYRDEARFNRAVAYQSLDTGQGRTIAQAELESLAGGQATGLVERSRLQLAQLHLTLEQYSQAATSATQVLDAGSEGAVAERAHLFRGLARQAQQDLAGAAQDFGQIPSTSSLYVRAALGHGHALVSLERYAEAAEVLSAAAPVAGPSEPSFRYLLGQAHQALGQSDNAIDAFTAGLAAEPGPDLAVGLRLARGNVALLSGDATRAVNDFRWVVDNAADEGQQQQARDALAIAYLRGNRGDDALGLLDEMTARAASPEQQADLLSRILDLYFEQDDYARTQDVARRLLDLEFDDSGDEDREFGLKEKAWLLLGDAQIRSGAPEKAIETYRAALQQNPTGRFATDMQLGIATLQFAAGDLEEAAARFESLRAMSLSAEQAFTVEYYLANARYSLRQFTEARDLFAQLIDKSPSADERADLLFGLGESHYQLGDFEAASKAYRETLAEFPTAPSADDAQYNLAWCLIEMEQQDEAMAEFGNLLKMYPDSEYAASAQFTFGDYHYNKRDYRRAIEAYRLVERQYPQAEVTQKVPRLIGELRESLAYDEYARGLALMDSAEAADGSETYYRQAMEVFDAVRQEYPGTESEIGAISNMAVCLEALGQWREAVTLYEQVITMYEEQKATQEAFQFAKAHRDWIVSARL